MPDAPDSSITALSAVPVSADERTVAVTLPDELTTDNLVPPGALLKVRAADEAVELTWFTPDVETRSIECATPEVLVTAMFSTFDMRVGR